MTAEITLESLVVAQDQKRQPFYIPVYPPSVPYYLYRAVEDLEKWADALDRIDPYELDEDHDEIREHLDDSEPQEVAKVLRRLAESEQARRLIFFHAKGARGPTQKRADRDYLVAF